MKDGSYFGKDGRWEEGKHREVGRKERSKEKDYFGKDGRTECT